jgi:predicted nucleic acid-binding protein
VIVLDASVLIAHLESTDSHHERATQLLLDSAEQPLGASPLTLAEVLVGPARADKLGLAEATLRELEVTTIPLAQDALARLARMRALTRLRLPDCCVLLAAESVGGAVATFDDRLASSAVEIGLAVLG